MIRTVAVTLSALLSITPALAQYQGPGGTRDTGKDATYADTTVADIKADPQDDLKVRLEGRLIRQSGDEDYVFADSTGEIAVEIDSDDFPKAPVTADTIVILEGEVDTHRMKDTDIDADRVTIKP